MLIFGILENPICARQTLLAAEKQAHVWPTLPLQPHSTWFDCICRRRHSTSRPLKRTLPWTRPVPRLQLIIVIMPHLAFTLISVLAHVAAQETRITDPATAASGEKAKLYELMKAEYSDERCEEGLFLVKRSDEPNRRLRGAHP